MKGNKNESKELPSVVQVTIDGNSFSIEYPKVRQEIAIESRKMVYSGGQYGMLVRAKTEQANRVLDLVDALSTFEILIPDWANKLNAEGIDDISPIQAAKMIKAYKTEFYPWYREWNLKLKKIIDGEE